jgi:branched-chain amino acid transport system permease protein
VPGAADAVGAQRSGTVLIMAYIGGAGHFGGPVLGAIVITWLQISLSDFTSAWLFYLGVFFMLMILYAPNGLWSVIAAHHRMWRSAARTAVLKSYALALLPVLAIMWGAILLIEMCYRLSTQAELGTRMRLLWMSVDAGTPWPWLAAGVAIAIGVLLLWKVSSRVRQAWDGVPVAGLK